MAGRNWQILAAALLAVPAGLLAGDVAVAGLSLTVLCEFAGTVFLTALRMLVIPLVAASLIAGLGGAGAVRGFGRLGVRTLACFFLTTMAAVLVGLLVVNLVQPGIVHGQPARDLLAAEGSVEFTDEIADKGLRDLVEVLPSIVPGNFLSAAASDDLIGVIFFCALFGHLLARLAGPKVEVLLRMADGMAEVMMRMTTWVMAFAPLGLFALLVPAIARNGAGMLGPLAGFAGVALLALALHALVTLPLLMRFAARVSPVAVYRTALPALLTAVATGSASAALPATMECMERRAGISGRVAGFVLSAGAVINMNGTALYAAVAAMFLAQAYGVHLGLTLQATVAALALASAPGLPGIPTSSLVSLSIILGAVGVPAEAAGALLALDRLFEMGRTGVNVLGDVTCAAIVARLEGEAVTIAEDAGRDAARP